MDWKRARAQWREWDEATRRGQRPDQILPRLTDEQIIDLLMSLESERRVERDVLATEAHNRLVRRRRALRRLVAESTGAVDRVKDAMGRAWPEVEATVREAREVLQDETPPSSGDVVKQTKNMARLVDVVRDALQEASDAAERLRAFEGELRQLADLGNEATDGDAYEKRPPTAGPSPFE